MLTATLVRRNTHIRGTTSGTLLLQQYALVRTLGTTSAQH